jgi:hypothetical protein
MYPFNWEVLSPQVWIVLDSLRAALLLVEINLSNSSAFNPLLPSSQYAGLCLF